MNSYLDDDNNVVEPSAHELLREMQIARKQRYKKFKADTITYSVMYGFGMLFSGSCALIAYTVGTDIISTAFAVFVQSTLVSYHAINLYKELKVSIRGMYENRTPR